MRHLIVALLLAGTLGHGHTRMARYDANDVSFSYPPAWRYSFGHTSAPTLHYNAFVWLSTSPLHDPCTVVGNATTCTTASDGLDPGGVLVKWEWLYVLPGSRPLGAGRHIRIGGRAARLVVARSRVVATIVVAQGAVLRMAATFRPPDLRANRARVLRMLATVRIVTA